MLCAEANEPTEQSAASTVARPTLEIPGRDGLFEFVSDFILCFGFSIFTIRVYLGACRFALIFLRACFVCRFALNSARFNFLPKFITSYV